MTAGTDSHERRLAQMELLFEKFHSRLYLYALTLLEDEDEARDVVGEVFATVWQQWTGGKGRGDGQGQTDSQDQTDNQGQTDSQGQTDGRRQSDRNKGDEVSATFLYTATRNRCLDLLRHRQAARNYQALLSATDFVSSEAEVAEYEARITELRQAVDRLPEPGQTILKHCYYKKMSYKQTAEALGVSESVVHRQMMKVLKILRGVIKR